MSRVHDVSNVFMLYSLIPLEFDCVRATFSLGNLTCTASLLYGVPEIHMAEKNKLHTIFPFFLRLGTVKSLSPSCLLFHTQLQAKSN